MAHKWTAATRNRTKSSSQMEIEELLDQLKGAEPKDYGELKSLVAYLHKTIVADDEMRTAQTEPKSKLVGAADQKLVVRLATELETPIYHMGLFDEADEHVLRLSLYSAAGEPQVKRKYSREDRSTWTYENLEHQKMADLVGLQLFAGRNYVCLLNNFVVVQSMTEQGSNNIYPFKRYCFPADKSSLRTQAGNAIEFRMVAEAFDSGTGWNTRAQ